MFLILNMFFLLLLLNFILMYKFKSSFLMILVSMEFFVITNLMLMLNYELGSYNEWFFIFYMVFSVCESVIGLTIMVNLIYYYGNQSVMMLNLW